MRTIGIRELSSDVIEELIESSDLLGVTNGERWQAFWCPWTSRRCIG